MSLKITDIRPEVLAFALVMEKKLRVGDLRYGGQSWKTATPQELLRFMRVEDLELRQALATEGREEVTIEAADVANFAMMIADVAGELPIEDAVKGLVVAKGAIRKSDVQTLGSQLPKIHEKPVQVTRNAAQCRVCGTVIESHHRHDFKWCPCKSIYVDGGLDYLRRGGEFSNIIDLSEYKELK